MNKNRNKDYLKYLLDEAIKKTNIKVNKKQRELLEQILSFVVVGVIATLIDWVIYFICCNYIKIDPLISNIISFSVSVVYNFWASCKYVFNVNKEKDRKKQFVVFIVFALIGLLLNELILYVFIKLLSWNFMLVQVMGTAIVMVFNFVTRKKFLE